MHSLILLLVLSTLPATTNPGSVAGPGRDPFRGPSDPAAEAPCDGTGLACVSWQRVKLTAIVSSTSGAMAALEAVGGASFMVSEGQQLRNAVLMRIDPERNGVLLREPMPGTLAGYREIVLHVGADEPIIRGVVVPPVLSVDR